MENKKPNTAKQAAKELAAFIARTSPCCPVNPNVPVPNCECWGSAHCVKCILQHADKLYR